MQVVDRALNLAQLKKIPLIRPATAGAVWGGVRHSAYADYILDEIEDRGWDVDEQWYYTARRDMNLIATYRVRTHGGTDTREGLMLAVTVGNDRKNRARYYVGWGRGRTWAIMVGQYVVPERRTHGTEVPVEVAMAIDWWAGMAKHVRPKLDGWRGTPMGADRACRLLVTATRGLRDPLLAPSRVGVADRAYTTGPHRGTAYGLLRAYGVAAMAAPPMLRYANMYRFYRLVTRRAAAT